MSPCIKTYKSALKNEEETSLEIFLTQKFVSLKWNYRLRKAGKRVLQASNAPGFYSF